MKSHLLSSDPEFTAFLPPPPVSVPENHWQENGKSQVCRSCTYAGFSGVSLLGSLADLTGLILREQTDTGFLWNIDSSPQSANKDLLGVFWMSGLEAGMKV